MNQIFQNTIGSAILAIVISMIAGVGIALFYVRYLRQLRIPAQERTGVDTYGLLILGIIAMLVGVGGMVLLFYIYPTVVTIVMLLLFLMLFTSLFVFVARRSYKRSL